MMVVYRNRNTGQHVCYDAPSPRLDALSNWDRIEQAEPEQPPAPSPNPRRRRSRARTTGAQPTDADSLDAAPSGREGEAAPPPE